MRKSKWQSKRVERGTITKRDSTGKSTHTRRVIIADDFTGACDVGVQFAKHGVSTSVIFHAPSPQELKVTAGLVVYDTETRNESEKEAYRRVQRFCSACQKAGVGLAYKKIDSTLRGNLGAELQAILNCFRQSSVVICPTYPEYRRTVVNGHLLVNGVPVDRTNDPSSPVRSSDIRTLLMSQTSESVGGIQLSTVRNGSHQVCSAIRQLTKRGIRVVWADAENRNDLKSVAGACFQSNLIPCGSAG